MLNRFDTRAFYEGLELKVFSESISPTEYHTFYCDCNVASNANYNYYRVKRVVTIIDDPANRDLDRMQWDFPIVDYPANTLYDLPAGGERLSEKYEFVIANNPTSSADITQKDGYTVTWKPVTI